MTISPSDGQESQQVGTETAPGNSIPELNRVYGGDCLDVMAGWPENFVESIITDPPYGLSFMGKDWDHGVPGPHFWLEALRIAKPGAFLLAFGGTRTYHRLACAIEDAGWEIRDCLMWLYGSGFPKSLDISKAIDKAKGAEREVVGERQKLQSYGHDGNNTYGGDVERNGIQQVTAPATDLAKQWSGWGTALKPAWEPIILAMKPTNGTFAQNAEKWGVAGINVDGGRIGTERITAHGGGKNGDGRKYGGGVGIPAIAAGSNPHTGRWPANLILDEEAAAMLDGQSGGLGISKGGSRGGNRSLSFGMNAIDEPQGFGDTGGASRFFYVAKADRAERNEGCANGHPTVKPLYLMKYLCNLTRTPTGGIVLDPFCGSGTTLWAAEFHNRPWLGIEMNSEYVAIAEARLARERAQIKMAI